MELQEFSERQVSMQAIRWLCQTAEALALCLTVEIGNTRAVANVIRLCSDHAEHIADLDILAAEESGRMSGIARSLDWLAMMLDDLKDVLQAGPPFRLTVEEVRALADIARRPRVEA